MAENFQADIEMVDMRAGLGRSFQVLFRAADLDDAVAAAWRLIRRMDQDPAARPEPRYNVPGAIRVIGYGVAPIDASGRNRPRNPVEGMYEWKRDFPFGREGNEVHAAATPVEADPRNLYQATLVTCPPYDGFQPHTTVLHFEAGDTADAVAAVRRWLEWQQTSRYIYCGDLANLEVARLSLGPIGDDGAPTNEVLPLHVETVPDSAPAPEDVDARIAWALDRLSALPRIGDDAPLAAPDRAVLQAVADATRGLTTQAPTLSANFQSFRMNFAGQVDPDGYNADFVEVDLAADAITVTSRVGKGTYGTREFPRDGAGLPAAASAHIAEKVALLAAATPAPAAR